MRGNGSKKPLLLLAHVDVVPVEGQPWTSPPFTPIEKDGFLIARGVGDDKGMAAAATAIVLELARNKTPLARDVVLALTAGEETGGDAGVRFLVTQHRELLDAELVLNEGGSLQLAPDLSALEAVLISVGEKTFQSYRLIAKSEGGHSSMPPPPDRIRCCISRARWSRSASTASRPGSCPRCAACSGSGQVRAGPLGQAMARIAKSGKLAAKDEAILATTRSTTRTCGRPA